MFANRKKSLEARICATKLNIAQQTKSVNANGFFHKHFSEGANDCIHKVMDFIREKGMKKLT